LEVGVDIEALYAGRRQIETPLGAVSYLDVGSGNPALFVHGVLVSSYLWRHVIAVLADHQRCIAIDLPGHGRSLFGDGQDLSLTGLAGLLSAFCDELGLPAVDLVGNDTGGAVCQVFAARHPERLRSLTLTNCDTEWCAPAPAAAPAVAAARAGKFAARVHLMAADHGVARTALAIGFEHPERLSDEDLDAYLEGFSSLSAARGVERLIAAFDEADLRSARPALAELAVPTLIVWGTGDIFFPLSSAYQLRDLLPGARDVAQLEGAKLFFPDERADELAPLIVGHWQQAAR
jgi:pimeloyl-ACP methyl ester carboxylesterase